MSQLARHYPTEMINKVIVTIIYNWLLEAVEPVLCQEQVGFRPHRICIDNINTLRIIGEQSTEFRSPLFLAFIDFERAFDTLTPMRYGSPSIRKVYLSN
jgi:hypothetical protein